MRPGMLLLLLFQMMLWGSAYPMIKLGLTGLSAQHLTLLRHLVASAAFVPLLLVFKGRLRPVRADVPYLFLVGVLGYTVYHLALNFGELHVSAGAASLIIATAPAITALLAVAMAGERLAPLGWAGSVVSFLGVIVIVMGDSRGGISFNVWAWLIVLSAVSTSFYAVLQKPLFTRYKPIEVAAFATWAGTVPLLVFLPGLGGEVLGAPAEALGATLYIGLFPSAVAYTIFAFALSRTPITVVTAFLYLVPVFGLLSAWLLIGEVPALVTLVGGAIAVLGIVLVNLSKRRERSVARGLPLPEAALLAGEQPADVVAVAVDGQGGERDSQQ
ncbi:MAG: DMT family transporter [Truepera sp.]|nr:DMT family transporter [Truepera sp.]